MAEDTSTQDLLEAIAKHWIQSEDEFVQNNGNILLQAISESQAGVSKLLKDPPEPAPQYVKEFDQLECKDVELILHEKWTLLPWQQPCSLMGTTKYNGKIKVAELYRNSCVILRLFHFEAGVKLPQHAKTAKELLHILSAKKAKIGPIDEWVKDVENKFYDFLPMAPQVIQAGGDSPLLYLSFLERPSSSPSEVKLWFSDIGSGDNYSTDIMAIENVESYYNKMASDYEDSMLGWGYSMPEAIADALVKHGKLAKEASILDLGCGSGWCGQALFNRGIEDLNGVDFSSEMLKQCAKRACYNTLQKADLLTALPFEDNKFDCLISVAVTTYLNPTVLSLWLKVAKPGGLLSFTHKTSVWPDWEVEQDRLETAGLWQKVWVSNAIPYLPSLKEAGGDEPCTEMAKVYIYKKI